MPGSGRWEPLGLRRTGRRVNSEIFASHFEDVVAPPKRLLCFFAHVSDGRGGGSDS